MKTEAALDKDNEIYEPKEDTEVTCACTGKALSPATRTGAANIAKQREQLDLTHLADSTDTDAHEAICSICFDDFSGNEDPSSSRAAQHNSITLNCSHTFHGSCLSRHLVSETAFDKATKQYACPKCKADNSVPTTSAATPATRHAQTQQQGRISQYDITQLLLTGHITPSNEAALSRQLVHCAAGASYSCIGCNALLQLEPGLPENPRANTATCPLCSTEQCCRCGTAWTDAHDGLTCAQVQAAQQPPDPKTQKLLETVMPCPGPGCQHGLVKTGGCNHMFCHRCNSHSCWFCGQLLQQSAQPIYQHYNDSSSTCYGLQYTQKRPLWLSSAAAKQQKQLLQAEQKQQRKQQQEQARRMVEEQRMQHDEQVRLREEQQRQREQQRRLQPARQARKKRQRSS